MDRSACGHADWIGSYPVGVRAEVAFRHACAGAANGLAQITEVLGAAGFEIADLTLVVIRRCVMYEADACFVNRRCP